MITANKIIDTISAQFLVPRLGLMSPRRNRYLAEARFACYFLCREVTKLSYTQIGRVFSRDHTTILGGVRRAENLISTNAKFAQRVNLARETLGSENPVVDTGFIILLEKFSELASESGYTISITRGI